MTPPSDADLTQEVEAALIHWPPNTPHWWSPQVPDDLRHHPAVDLVVPLDLPHQLHLARTRARRGRRPAPSGPRGSGSRRAAGPATPGRGAGPWPSCTPWRRPTPLLDSNGTRAASRRGRGGASQRTSAVSRSATPSQAGVKAIPSRIGTGERNLPRGHQARLDHQQDHPAAEEQRVDVDETGDGQLSGKGRSGNQRTQVVRPREAGEDHHGHHQREHTEERAFGVPWRCRNLRHVGIPQEDACQTPPVGRRQQNRLAAATGPADPRPPCQPQAFHPCWSTVRGQLRPNGKRACLPSCGVQVSDAFAGTR